MKILNKNTYQFIDFFTISYKANKITTLIIMANMVITALVPTVALLVTNTFVGIVMQIVQGQADKAAVVGPLFIYILIIAWNYLSNSVLHNFIYVRHNMQLQKGVISELIDKRGKLEYKHVESDDAWNLVTRVCNNALFHFTTGLQSLFDIIDVTIRILSLLIILSLQEWWIGLLISVFVIPMIKVSVRSGKAVYEAKKEVERTRRESDYLSSVLTDKVYIEEKAIFNYCNKINELWKLKFEKVKNSELVAELRRIIKMRITGIVTLFFAIVIVGVLLIPTMKGTMSVGMFIALVNASFSLVSMMSWRLSYVSRKYAEECEFLKDLSEFLNLSECMDALREPKERVETINEIEFRNVYFKYPESCKYILKGVNFKLKKGIHYALVGINGAGKSTIIKLLTKMYSEYEGEILINGRELHEYSMPEIKKIFNITFQDFAKYQFTIKDNIKYGNINEKNDVISTRKILAVLEQMRLDKEINSLAYGIDTQLGKLTENGIDFSGGQWQKIALSRSLYSEAQITILDEPTAALDPVSESEIFTLINNISLGKTMIFITHRMGAAKMAEQIIVIDDGKVVEQGNHEALMKRKKQYYEMYQNQVQWYR